LPSSAISGTPLPLVAYPDRGDFPGDEAAVEKYADMAEDWNPGMGLSVEKPPPLVMPPPVLVAHATSVVEASGPWVAPTVTTYGEVPGK